MKPQQPAKDKKYTEKLNYEKGVQLPSMAFVTTIPIDLAVNDSVGEQKLFHIGQLGTMQTFA
jgi:hypothetical protein